MNAKLSHSEFIKLRDVIYQASGMFFTDNKKYFLEARLTPRLVARGLSSFEDYYHLLNHSLDRQREMQVLIGSVTTHETSFFREMPQFQLLKSELFPRVTNRKTFGIKQLRIWSAACSSGEEPYTIAMIANEDAILSKLPWNVEIVGTDISDKVLDRARRGIYSDYAMRNIPQFYKLKHFVQTEEGYQIRHMFPHAVRFMNLNLCDWAKMDTMRNFDIVFCRNTLIYFDTEAKTKVIDRIYNSLVPGGYLLISMTESLFGISNKFKMIRLNGCVIYQK